MEAIAFVIVMAVIVGVAISFTNSKAESEEYLERLTAPQMARHVKGLQRRQELLWERHQRASGVNSPESQQILDDLNARIDKAMTVWQRLTNRALMTQRVFEKAQNRLSVDSDTLTSMAIEAAGKLGRELGISNDEAQKVLVRRLEKRIEELKAGGTLEGLAEDQAFRDIMGF